MVWWRSWRVWVFVDGGEFGKVVGCRSYLDMISPIGYGWRNGGYKGRKARDN